jgi:hypothetical protein
VLAGPFSRRTPVLQSSAEGAWDSWKLVDPHNPVVDLAPETGCEVPTVFCHHGRLGMLLLTFSPRRCILLVSEDGVRWTIAQDPFSRRTGHGHMDIGLVKDTKNNLLPYYFQMNRSTPMTIKGYHLLSITRTLTP